MPIEFYTIPEECNAKITFKDPTRPEETWQAEIYTTGEIANLEDLEGNKYTTPSELDQAGVKTFILINHHEVDVEFLVDYEPEEPSPDYDTDNGNTWDSPYATETIDRV